MCHFCVPKALRKHSMWHCCSVFYSHAHISVSISCWWREVIIKKQLCQTAKACYLAVFAAHRFVNLRKNESCGRNNGWKEEQWHTYIRSESYRCAECTNLCVNHQMCVPRTLNTHQWHCCVSVQTPLNSFPSSVPIWHRLAKLSILILEGILKKISYERCDYESVDKNSLS